ncbi:MAG: hypothetical protein V5A34_05705 [Halapricum sp.]
MTRQTLTRRRILATVAGVGVLGAVSGSGARAYYTDRSAVPAALAAAALELTACVEDGSDCRPVDAARIDLPIDLDEAPEGHARIRIDFPADVSTTPGYLWLRSSCPDGTCGLERALEVTVRADADCDSQAGTDASLLASGSLCSVLETLGSGVLLGDDPFEPGARVCLDVEWSLGAICSVESIDVGLELFAHQAAHSGGPQRPWTTGCSVTCKTAADCVCGDHGISFVAFCVPDGTALASGDVDFEWRTGADGEPVAIEWTSTVDLSRVTLFYGSPDGPVFENFAGGRTGTATVGAGGPVLPGQSPSNPAPDGEVGLKYEYADGVFLLGDGEAGRPDGNDSQADDPGDEEAGRPNDDLETDDELDGSEDGSAADDEMGRPSDHERGPPGGVRS